MVLQLFPNDLAVKSPVTSDLLGWDLALLGKLVERRLRDPKPPRHFRGSEDLVFASNTTHALVNHEAAGFQFSTDSTRSPSYSTAALMGVNRGPRLLSSLATCRAGAELILAGPPQSQTTPWASCGIVRQCLRTVEVGAAEACVLEHDDNRWLVDDPIVMEACPPT